MRTMAASTESPPCWKLTASTSTSNGLMIRREISAGGKGRVWVNNQAATVGVLKQLAPLLAAIHSQTESMFAFAFDARAGGAARLLRPT